MKTIVTLAAALISSVAAAPAILWTSDSSYPTIHSSAATEFGPVLKGVLSNTSDKPSLASAIFVLNRDKDGTDGLTSLSSSGSLPTIATLYDSAYSMQHYVRGLDSIKAITKNVRSAAGSAHSVVETTLEEFKAFSVTDHTDEATVASDGSIVHKRALSAASIVIVHVSKKACPKAIDATVAAAIGNADIGSVILTTMRSTDEAKLERDLEYRSKKSGRYSRPKQARRKLEQNEQNEAQDGNGDFEAGTYFVNFTPNIFAGFMFFLFFVGVTYTGISCMGMIANDNVYTKVYPAIGREA